MYKFIQKNQKKFLAIFGVLLMIVFILPSSVKNNMTRGDLAIGSIDGEKITGNELGQARADLELFRQNEFLPLLELGGAPENQGEIGVYAKYFRGDDGALAYLLLQKEAEKQGFSVSDQAAASLAAASFKTPGLPEELAPAVGRFMLVQGAFERASASVKVSKPLDQFFISQALQASTLNLVEYSAAEMEKSVPAPTTQQVREQYYKYGDALPVEQSFLTTKPSTPGYKVPDRVKLQYLELPRTAVVDSVLSGLSREDLYQLDLESFRYYTQHPDEFQTPPIPATLPSTVPSTTTSPSTNPSTGPATLPTAIPALPTTKPYADVELDLRQRLLTDASASSAELVVALRAKVAAREKESSRPRFTMNWRTTMPDGPPHMASRRPDTQPAGPTTDPTSSPTSNPATNPILAIYPDLDFLTDFANTFEAQYKVRPLVHSLANKWLTQDDLRLLPDLESAKAGALPFYEYAMRDLSPVPTTRPAIGPAGPPIPSNLLPTQPSTSPTTEPTTNPAQASPESLVSWHPIGTGLRPFEPSVLLQDSTGNAFIFRLTAFEPAHQPPLAEVESTIIAQLTSAAAFQCARDEATKLLASAQFQSKLEKEHKLADIRGLPAAARASDRKLIEAGPFQARELQRFRPIQGYDPADFGDKFSFTRAVSDLARQQTVDNPYPSMLIELPAEKKVLVAEMGDAVMPVPADQMFDFGQMVVPKIRKMLEQGQITGPQAAPGSDFLQDWFDLNNVIARVKYVKGK